MKRRQFHTEKNTTPLAMIHAVPSATKIMMNKICIAATLIFWGIYVASTIFDQFVRGNREFQKAVETGLYILIVTSLCFSALIYMISRHGALTRFKEHSRIPRATLEGFFAEHQPGITVLIPSYDEEVAVIRQTMLSAALQEYPDLRVRLLIDDKPNPKDLEKRAKLEATIALAGEINELLNKPYRRFQAARQRFENAHENRSRVHPGALLDLKREYEYAVQWLRMFADHEPQADHVDDFFNNRVLRDLADELAVTARALQQAAEDKGCRFSVARVDQMYSRLVWIFTAEVDYFQRKEYISLSNEANKAMNLNSYIDLMGGSYHVINTPDGKILQHTEDPEKTDVTIPDSEYLLTLDADSILLREYCLRLVYLLNQPGNERVAVTQTPYSSFRGCSTRIERIAGATTDIQHILHQGTTYFGATFWVGANAVIRKKALEDIAEEETVNGFKIRRFIQDRTVIEDTESSIDLEKHGWTLKNYPERLSYSATPPDYGSLIIQRRRWANGGLLILGKLFATIRRRKKEGRPLRRMEIALRVNYMASIAWASFGLIFLLAYPFDDRLLSVYILAAAVPYFACMASDLKYCRYRRSDIFRIYGFNLLLLAVNLAGVIKSLQQLLSGEKIPFARTPKVKDRTGSPTLYIVAPLVIIGFSAFICGRSVMKGNWPNAVFALFNAVTCLWAVLSYVGIFNMLADLLNNFYHWLFVEVKEPAAAGNGDAEPDWRSVLYYGSSDEKLPVNTTLETVAEQKQAV